MVTQPDGEQYKKAIELAEQERNQLVSKLKDLEKIQKRLSQLEMFIEQGRVLLGVEPKESPLPLALSPMDEADDSKKPIHLRAKEILQEFGKPMRVPEIVAEFRKRKWKLSENNGALVLRRAFREKTHLFTKDEHGLYSLKN